MSDATFPNTGRLKTPWESRLQLLKINLFYFPIDVGYIKTLITAPAEKAH